MIRKIIKFFDRLEDKVRAKLSHYPIWYALVGGVGVVLFWRGIWHAADEASIGPIVSIILGSILLLLTGVFVSAFIGNRLILTGLRGEKKLSEKQESDIQTEETQLQNIQNTLNKVEKKLSQIESEVKEK